MRSKQSPTRSADALRPASGRSAGDNAMLQFGLLFAVLGLLELWKTHYVLGLFALGGGLMMPSSTKLPLDFKVTRRSLFTPVDDCMATNRWEKTARLLAALAFAGGASVAVAKLLA